MEAALTVVLLVRLEEHATDGRMLAEHFARNRNGHVLGYRGQVDDAVLPLPGAFLRLGRLSGVLDVVIIAFVVRCGSDRLLYLVAVAGRIGCVHVFDLAVIAGLLIVAGVLDGRRRRRQLF